MRILLIRHCESEKNVLNSFSSEADDEPLTESARNSLIPWARSLRDWANRIGCTAARVHSTESRRSLETASALGDTLGVPVVGYAALRSTRAGALAGVSKQEAERTHPEFVEQLRLYRVGLFNAYDFTVAEGKEPKADFEKRVEACLSEILARSDEDLKVIVTHRASITSILMSVARREYGYPTNFFGYVPLDLGHISLLETTAEGRWRIRGVNLEVSHLLDGYV